MFRKKDVFFSTLEQLADVIFEAADRFATAVNADIPDVSAFAKEMKEFEHEGDRHAHLILTELNKNYLTAIKREDIMELTKRLDDVLDGIEACASRFDMYQVSQMDVYIRKFGACLLRCAIEIKSAVYLLTQKKLLAMQEHCVKIHELENEGDELMRTAIKSLFQNPKDPLELMKYKEIYERLEETTDSCEDAANSLQTIIMRNS